MLFTVVQVVQEPERTMPRQAEAQASRAPLQVQSSNVQAPAMAQAVQASSKPVHQPAGPAAARLPWPQQPQVKHSFLRSHQHLEIAYSFLILHLHLACMYSIQTSGFG